MGFDGEPTGETPYQLLDADGTLVDDRPASPTDDVLSTIFYEMRLARRLDERGVALQRQGTFGIYGEVAGQEAGMVASSHALSETDWVVPSYREYPSLVSHGMPLRYLFAWLIGHYPGNALPSGLHALPLCIPVATQLPHAVGIAHALKYTGGDGVVLVHFGDGATSEGDFHEAMNFAGVFDLPTVFFCHNNQWAISTPRDRQTASDTIARKADAYGFEGVQVDGMDPLAVHEVTCWARERARRGKPTLVEAVEYRYGAHTTADDPSAYRDESEVERWRERDPLRRTEAYLRGRDVIDDEALAEMDERIETQLAAELEAAEALVDTPEGMFEHVFETVPPEVATQAAELEALRERHGDEHFVGE
jgi:pyruvate dehydrogenase E1 component alpha subunit